MADSDSDSDFDGERDLPAGDFSPWLADMQRAVRGERGMDVPCNGCTACCRSSQFVHIAPDEADTAPLVARVQFCPSVEYQTSCNELSLLGEPPMIHILPSWTAQAIAARA